MSRMYRYLKHCKCNLKNTPSHINAVQIRQYLTPMADSMYNQSLAALHIIYDKVLNQPRKLKNLSYRKTKKNVWVVLSKDDIVDILKQTSNPKHKAIIACLYFLGMRTGELLNLKFSDIDRNNMRIHVRGGKGNKDRQITITSNMLDMLEHYYKSCKVKPKIYVFEGQKKGKYSSTSVNNIVKRHQDRIGKDIWPHLFRHSIATHMINGGVNVLEIMRFLGHNDIKTTEYYYQYLESKGIIRLSTDIFRKLAA